MVKMKALLISASFLGAVGVASSGPLPGQPVTLALGANHRAHVQLPLNRLQDSVDDYVAATDNGLVVATSGTGVPGGFVISQVAATVGQNIVAIAKPDLDGDGFPDLAWLVQDTSGSLTYSCAIIEATGVITVNCANSNFSGGSQNTILSCQVNFDNDGLEDWFVLLDDKLAVCVAQVGGTLAPPVFYSLPAIGYGLAVGKLDGDALSDVAISMRAGGQSVLALRSTGNTASPFAVLSSIQVPGVTSWRLAAGDRNGDGFADLALLDTSSSTTTLLDNDGTGTLSIFGTLPALPGPLLSGRIWDLAWADLDGDSDDDLVEAADDWIYVASNSGGAMSFGDFSFGMSQPNSLIASNTTGDIASGGQQQLDVYVRGNGYHDGDQWLIGRGPVTGQGPEGRIYTADGAMLGAILPFASTDFGVNVASGDINGTPDPILGRMVAEILFAPGPGPQYGPQVRAFTSTAAQPIAKVNFYAYGTLRYGTNVSEGDLDGDSRAEILTGAGPGAVFGPHVRGWNFDGAGLVVMGKISFQAYGTLKYGVNVSGANVDTDTYAEILTGPGPSQAFAAQVRGWNFDGATLAPIAKINFTAFSTTYGAKVAHGDFDGDSIEEILVTPGPRSGNVAQFRGFNFDGSSLAGLPGFDLTEPTFGTRGAFATGADIGNAAPGHDVLVGSPGPDVSVPSKVLAWDYAGGSLTAISEADIAPFGTSATGGATLGAGGMF